MIASTTITVMGGEGSEFVSGTPIVVTIPIPDTTWTVPADGPVTFAQAPAGSLPNLPVGLQDKVIAVTGSIVVKPSLGCLRFVMDCQPGSTAAPNKVATPLAATPFAQLEAAAPVPPPPPPPTKPAGKPRVASSKLKLVAGRVAVTIACPAGTVACKGRVAVRSLAPLKLGAKRGILDLTASRAYTVPAGRQRVFKIAITPAARRVMRARKSLGLRVTLKPSAGATKLDDVAWEAGGGIAVGHATCCRVRCPPATSPPVNRRRDSQEHRCLCCHPSSVGDGWHTVVR